MVFAKSPKAEIQKYIVLSRNTLACFDLGNPRVIKNSSSKVVQENVNKFFKEPKKIGRFITLLHGINVPIHFGLGSYLGY